MKFDNGQEYDGEWVNGHKEGEGVYRFPSGAAHRGNFVNDPFEGHGIYKYPGGDIYMTESGSMTREMYMGYKI